MRHIYKIVLILVVSSVSLFSAGIETIGLSIGKSKSPSVQVDAPGYTVITEESDDKFKGGEIYTVFKDKIFGMKPYLSYSYNYNDDFRNQYVLAGLNKYYKLSSVKLYAGLLSGYGQLSWKLNPISGTNNDTSTQSIVYGLQGGVNISISSSWSLDINTKYLRHDYVTNLKTSVTTSEVTHYETMVGLIGLAYKF